jgi:hypothetical protein
MRVDRPIEAVTGGLVACGNVTKRATLEFGAHEWVVEHDPRADRLFASSEIRRPEFANDEGDCL